jgi:iron-sulfur cluster repair protein YtfE (RIC family)
MQVETLAAALEREHREIDAGIEDYVAKAGPQERDPARLRAAIAALRRHIYLEEEILFPPLRESGLVAPIFVMLREHAQLWQTTEALEHQLRLAGQSGGEDVVSLCHQLSVQLQHHNLKEERIIYPQADLVLAASASAALRDFLSTATLPSGWRCQRARS